MQFVLQGAQTQMHFYRNNFFHMFEARHQFDELAVVHIDYPSRFACFFKKWTNPGAITGM